MIIKGVTVPGMGVTKIDNVTTVYIDNEQIQIISEFDTATKGKPIGYTYTDGILRLVPIPDGCYPYVITIGGESC